jgi:hypothetical protein
MASRVARSTASSRPGKRASRSSRRNELIRVFPGPGTCRNTPASRSTLKCADNVDFDNGIPNVPHCRPGSSANVRTIATRAGSANACNTVYGSRSSVRGCVSGFIVNDPPGC